MEFRLTPENLYKLNMVVKLEDHHYEVYKNNIKIDEIDLNDENFAITSIEEGIFFVDASQVEWYHSTEPARKVDHVGTPGQFADSFQCTAAKKQKSFIGIVAEFAVSIKEVAIFCEILLVVDEVCLHASG